MVFFTTRCLVSSSGEAIKISLNSTVKRLKGGVARPKILIIQLKKLLIKSWMTINISSSKTAI